MRPVRTWRALMIACALCAVGASPALAGPAYTPITGSPFAAPSTSTSAWTAALNPNGTLLATPSFFGGSVTMFKVDPGSGTMTALGATNLTTVANGQIGNPVAVAFANAGATSYLAVVGEGGPNNVALYSVTSGGALTLIKAVTLGGVTEGVAFNSAGTRLAVGTISGVVQVYSVPDLTATDSKTLTGQAGGLAFNPSGTLLAVTLFDKALVQVYTIAGNGTLTAVAAGDRYRHEARSGRVQPGRRPARSRQRCRQLGLDVHRRRLRCPHPGRQHQPDGSQSGLGCVQRDGSPARNRQQGRRFALVVLRRPDRLADPGQRIADAHRHGQRAAGGGVRPGGWLAASSLTTGAIAVFAPAAPSATISSPTPGAHTYALGAVVGTAFTCADSTFGPGIASCTDSGGGASPGGRLSTSSIGAHTYTVTARSSDGQTSQTALGYRVAAKPSVSITVPRSGRTYRIRQRVSTAFGCREGAGGPGLVTCADSNGVSASHGRLDTTHFGRHSYSVTAISADGLQTLRSIAFRVAAAPSVTIGSPVAGAHYGVGQRVTARYGCADGLGGPGIASCHGTVRRGKRITTSRARPPPVHGGRAVQGRAADHAVGRLLRRITAPSPDPARSSSGNPFQTVARAGRRPRHGSAPSS